MGSNYLVDFGSEVIPRLHIVTQQNRCACKLGSQCPAVQAVKEYLHNGGKPAPVPMPRCPICGAETFRDRAWDGKYTHDLGWRCSVGGIGHFLHDKARRIRERSEKEKLHPFRNARKKSMVRKWRRP